MKQNIEDLLELSKKTLGSYIKKASRSADHHDKKGSAEEDKAMSTDGNKYPAKQQKHLDKAGEHFRKHLKRSVGVNTAKTKMKEEVEPITELSNTTYKSYSKKSSRDADKHINRFLKGGNEKSITHAEKRSKGINTAQQLMARKNMKLESKEEHTMEYNEADGHIALVQAILDGNREEANEIFDTVISARINPAIDARKEELAATMFAPKDIDEAFEFEPLPLTEETTHGHHHRVHADLTDRNNNLSNDAHNAYMSGAVTKDHKKEVMKHVKLAGGKLDDAKDKLGSAESADHLNAAAVHITNGGSHLMNVRVHTSLGFRGY